tara:strand:- start:1269 stop:1553 length:285 start_codon:yes stop_codon:yes gene_type:complete
MSFKDKNKFAKWLFRKRGYMSDNKFATELGFSRNTTGGWMYRDVRPRLVNAMQICQRLEESRGLCSKELWDELYEIMYQTITQPNHNNLGEKNG